MTPLDMLVTLGNFDLSTPGDRVWGTLSTQAIRMATGLEGSDPLLARAIRRAVLAVTNRGIESNFDRKLDHETFP